MKKILAVGSGGGHWEELMLLRDSLDRFDTHYASTEAKLAERAGITRFALLPDCNQNEPLRSLRCAVVAFGLVARLRPDYVVSTGAAPGFFCILWGRMMGARTIWVDNLASAERLSMCGRLSKKLATVCLTQWPHLARPGGPYYLGSVL